MHVSTVWSPSTLKHVHLFRYCFYWNNIFGICEGNTSNFAHNYESTKMLQGVSSHSWQDTLLEQCHPNSRMDSLVEMDIFLWCRDSQIMTRVHFMQSQSGCIHFLGYLHPVLCSLPPTHVPSHILETVSHCLFPRTKLCYWSLQHVYCLYTTEEAHLVMPSLPVSICAHQRELASKIKTESKTLLYDSIISFVPSRMSHRGRRLEIAYVCGKR